MSRDPKRPGEPPAAPEAAPKKPDHLKPDQPAPPKNPYGGVWAGGAPRDDPSGQGSAPWAPGGQPPAPKTQSAHQPGPKPHSAHHSGPDEPHAGEPGVYGGVWSSEGPREDPSGRGSAPRPPGMPSSEPRSFSKDGSKREAEAGPDIAADDAGASSKTETPQRRPE